MKYLLTVDIKPIAVKNLKTEKFSEVLRLSNIDFNKVGLLMIDVEGSELQILESIDLEDLKVPYLLIETHSTVLNFSSNPIVNYLEKYHYVVTQVFKRSTLFRLLGENPVASP